MKQLVLALAFSCAVILPLDAQAQNVPVQIPEPTMVLEGTSWRIQSYTAGQGDMLAVLPETQVTASFSADGTVAGNAGCNMYRAGYTLDGSSITFGPIVSTRRACVPDAVTAQEQGILAAFGASSTYDLVGDRLTLRGADGNPQILMLRQA